MIHDFPAMARQLYLEMGCTLVEPGSPAGVRFGLRLRDWRPDTFMAYNGKIMILPLLTARRPGNGAFPKLIARLDRLGYQVAISHPTGRFRDHLERTGWHCTEADLWVRDHERIHR